MSAQDTPEFGISGPELLQRLARRDPAGAAQAEATMRARGPIGRQLHVARLQAQLDAHELAEHAGIDPSCVTGIEHGTHDATRAELEQLGVALDIDFAIGKSSAA